MLVRPSKQRGIEVFMLRRSEASHFVPDVYVFPGGTVDAGDSSGALLARTCGLADTVVRSQFRAEQPASLPSPIEPASESERAGLLLAAIRELFEEAGVLLACMPDGGPLKRPIFGEHGERLSAARALLCSGERRFEEILEDLGVFADARTLALFSQWITPPVLPRRYNTHFFAAEAPEEQAAAADAFETHDGVWISPQDALDRCAAGTFRMVYPTVKHVERLADFATTGQLMQFAREKTIYRIMPQTTGATTFVLPPELERSW